MDERRDFLRLEYETLEKLQERDAPTVAVADGLAFGAGAGVFMACDERIVTERSRLAMPECRMCVPDAGALRFLTKHCEPRRRAVPGADGRAAQRARFIQDGPRDALRAGQGGFRFGSTLRGAVGERFGRGIDDAPRPARR